MTTKEKALEYFNRKFHCSQAILAAYADKCGLTEEQALKLGGCFGSGMRKGEVCGGQCCGSIGRDHSGTGIQRVIHESITTLISSI